MPINLLWRLLRHRRAVVLGALTAVIAAAWTYLLLGAGIDMEMMDMGGGQIMLMSPPWTVTCPPPLKLPSVPPMCA